MRLVVARCQVDYAGRLTAHPDVVEWVDDDFVVEAGDGEVWAGVDGEACALESPLHFHIHPRPLRVRVPPVAVPSIPAGAG